MNKIKGNMTFLNANRKNKGLSVLRGSFLNKIKRRVTLTICQLFDLLMTVLLSKRFKKKKKISFFTFHVSRKILFVCREKKSRSFMVNVFPYSSLLLEQKKTKKNIIDNHKIENSILFLKMKKNIFSNNIF